MMLGELEHILLSLGESEFRQFNFKHDILINISIGSQDNSRSKSIRSSIDEYILK